jgi:hypothetical protein
MRELTTKEPTSPRLRALSRRVALVAGGFLCFIAPLVAGQAQTPAPAGQAGGQDGQGVVSGGRAIDEQDQNRRNSVQVGVPEGRGGRAAGPAPGRGRAAGPPRPVPRGANGRPLWGGTTATEKGVWLPGAGGGASIVSDTNPLPFQPWAAAVLADRRLQQLEPHTRCHPSGVARQFLTPYGVEIVELEELERLFIFDIGGPHTYRTVYMDGRAHPKNITPSHYGHGIGWWEGDTLVIDTVGFNEGFWLDRRGSPHTTQLHTIEKLTRTSFDIIKYELTVDDPGAYTAKWTRGMDLRWEPNTELFEYQCQQSNYAPELMVGQHQKVDRDTLAVP